jgi:hypothetical protein
MLFREMFAVYSENRTKSTNTLCGKIAELFIVNADDMYGHHFYLTLDVYHSRTSVVISQLCVSNTKAWLYHRYIK